jgi:hypothetical protein
MMKGKTSKTCRAFYKNKSFEITGASCWLYYGSTVLRSSRRRSESPDCSGKPFEQQQQQKSILGGQKPSACRNSCRIQTESVKLYLLAVTEVVCLDKTDCLKVPAFLFLSLKIIEVMDIVVVTVDYIPQRAKLPIVSTYFARTRFGT